MVVAVVKGDHSDGNPVETPVQQLVRHHRLEPIVQEPREGEGGQENAGHGGD